MNEFENMGLKDPITSALETIGFKTPTPIQALTIPKMLASDTDITALAQTGTGKTAAFGLPVLQLTDVENLKIQTVVLCPTRELCLQITEDLKRFAQNMEKIRVVAVYGGADIRTQIKALGRGPQLVVGTPGRVKDLIKQGKLLLGHVSRVVLDEADEMLSVGFKEDLNFILGKMPQDKQTLLFSATTSAEIKIITEKYMNNPVRLIADNENTGTQNVKHIYYPINYRDKYLLLKRILDANPKIYAIIFCRQRIETSDIARKLIKDHYNAAALNGDLSQAQRSEVMDKFRNRQIRVLVATDIAARGLDVNELTHVINYTLPDISDTYTHRSGRTGRAGKKGISIAIMGLRDLDKIREIEKKSGISFTKGEIPKARQILHEQVEALVREVKGAKEIDTKGETISAAFPEIQSALEDLTREDLLNYFVAERVNRYISYYKGVEDMEDMDAHTGHRSAVGRDKYNRRDKRGRSSAFEKSWVKITVNIGREAGINPPRLMGVINEVCGGSKPAVGKIYMGDRTTDFDIEDHVAAQLTASNKTFEGKKLYFSRKKFRPRKDNNRNTYR